MEWSQGLSTRCPKLPNAATANMQLRQQEIACNNRIISATKSHHLHYLHQQIDRLCPCSLLCPHIVAPVRPIRVGLRCVTPQCCPAMFFWARLALFLLPSTFANSTSTVLSRRLFLFCRRGPSLCLLISCVSLRLGLARWRIATFVTLTKSYHVQYRRRQQFISKASSCRRLFLFCVVSSFWRHIQEYIKEAWICRSCVLFALPRCVYENHWQRPVQSIIFS